MEPIVAFAHERRVRLIEDAAQAHGALYNGQAVGSFGDAAAFSFYPAKNLGALGDAGAVTTNSEAISLAARRLRNYGGIAKYEHATQGRNSRLDPLQAAVLGMKLNRLAGWNARRREIAAAYLEGLSDLEGLALPRPAPGAEPVWHIFAVCSPARDALGARLDALGVETLVHYPTAVYRTGAFADF